MGSMSSKRVNKFHLLSSGPAEVVDLTYMGWHPIHKAAYFGNISEVKRLLATGAFYNAVDVEGRTPLHFARARRYGSNNDKIANILIKAGASDFSPADRKGRLPIDVYTMYNK